MIKKKCSTIIERVKETTMKQLKMNLSGKSCGNYEKICEECLCVTAEYRLAYQMQTHMHTCFISRCNRINGLPFFYKLCRVKYNFSKNWHTDIVISMYKLNNQKNRACNDKNGKRWFLSLVFIP